MPRYHYNRVHNPDEAKCPIVGLSIDANNHQSEWHTHQRAQLLYQANGKIVWHTENYVGSLTPLQAVWLPPGTTHRTIMHGQFSYRSLYFDPLIYSQLPNEILTIEIVPLLREIILRITEWPADQTLSPTQLRLIEVLFDELTVAHQAGLSLPLPEDKRALAIALALIEQPDLKQSLEIWGKQVGASSKTLSRLFLKQTGLSFTQWRTQSRLLSAQNYLTEGLSVTNTAHLLGYSSDSAFVAMYRRVYGTSPGKRNKK